MVFCANHCTTSYPGRLNYDPGIPISISLLLIKCCSVYVTGLQAVKQLIDNARFQYSKVFVSVFSRSVLIFPWFGSSISAIICCFIIATRIHLSKMTAKFYIKHQCVPIVIDYFMNVGVWINLLALYYESPNLSYHIYQPLRSGSI